MFFKILEEMIASFGLSDILTKIITVSVEIIIIAAICIFLCVVIAIVHKVISSRAKSKTLKTLAKSSAERHLVTKLSWFISCLVISGFAYVFPNYEHLITKIMTYILIVILMLLVDCVLKIINDLYCTRSISKRRPIKGLLQIARVLIFMVLGIIMISMFINQSPLVLLGGIGTFTAIISIVFKDALLGLVAGVQITSDDLLRIGDWVEIPSEKVEGTVQDISLISVKILAFDNTLYTIPAYTFLSVPFRNWHTALKNNARRVMRTISVDVHSVKNLSSKDLAPILKEYSEFEDLKSVFDERKEKSGDLTNLGVFMELLPRLIKKDENVRKDKLIICQINETKCTTGIPVEYFFFTDQTDWGNYSKISAEKSELALKLLKELDLRPFQSRSDVNP